MTHQDGGDEVDAVNAMNVVRERAGIEPINLEEFLSRFDGKHGDDGIGIEPMIEGDFDRNFNFEVAVDEFKKARSDALRMRKLFSNLNPTPEVSEGVDLSTNNEANVNDKSDEGDENDLIDNRPDFKKIAKMFASAASIGDAGHRWDGEDLEFN